jgi:hypothetical protein
MRERPNNNNLQEKDIEAKEGCVVPSMVEKQAHGGEEENIIDMFSK